MRTTLKRTLAALGAATVIAAVTVTPATAHVTVSSPDAARGGYGKLVFRVPNESDRAATTKLRVTLPKDTPFAHVSPKPLPGWKVRANEVKLPEPVESGDLTLTDAVRTVTWTAQGGGIDVGMFDEFELVVGPFPEDATALMFPAVQTYADGEVVRWDQPTPDDGAEPEHPAPMLDLAAQGTVAESSHADGDEGGAAVDVTAESESSGADEADASDTTARTLGAGGLVLGVIALGSAVLVRRGEGETKG